MWDTLYRPLRFADVLGQQGAVRVLKQRLRNGSALDRSYIFSGGAGQGKTTLARILARAMLCERLKLEDPDPCNECDNCQAVLNEQPGAFIEMDAASQGTIDNVRRLVDDLAFAVFGARKRIYLFDECHRMSKDAQDVLLKPLEEKKMVGLFCTTEPEKIRGPIRSRCEEHPIRKVTREDVLARMKWILDQEKVEHEDDAIYIVIDYSGGHVRDVVNKLEMISQMGSVTVDSVRSYLNLSTITTYYEILLALRSSVREALALIEKACDRVTPEEVASGLAEAAMNSFRLAKGMLADFVFADRELGKRVYDIYGNEIVKVAEFFLRSRYATYVGLVCDAVTLGQSLGTRDAAPVFSPLPPAPVILMGAPGPSEGAAIAIPVSIPIPIPIPPSPTSPAPPSVAPAPPVATPSPVSRAKGNLGSADVQALTDFDTNVLGSKEAPAQKYRGPIQYGDQRNPGVFLTPAAWMDQFRTLIDRGIRGG